MIRSPVVAALITSLIPAVSTAQIPAAQRSAEPYLVNLVQEWGRESRLGDLATARFDTGDVELRFWGGFGMGATRGIVLRRFRGEWSATLATEARCFANVPLPAGDTLSDASIRRYKAEAIAHCGANDTATTSGSILRVIEADTLALEPVPVPHGSTTWDALVKAGLLALPAGAPLGSVAIDGHAYVVELRRGRAYRGSELECNASPSDADRHARAVERVLMASLPLPQWIPCSATNGGG